MKTEKNHRLWIFTAIFMAVWINSLTGTTDIHNWMIENILTILSLVFLIFSYRTYRFSDISYFLIMLFLCFHVYGSKYSYAENTFGYWLKDYFNLSRNPYDRIVHFNFGFLLYYPLMEFFRYWLKYPLKLSLYLPVIIVLSFSGAYEIIEWLIADVFFTEQGTTYLGTQGDVWDPQKDMALAFVGAVIAYAVVYYLFSRSKSVTYSK